MTFSIKSLGLFLGALSLSCSFAMTGAGSSARAAKPAIKQAYKAATCKKRTASGLGYSILKTGKGAGPGAQDKVTISYRGTLAKDGSEFDANAKARFAVSEVISGFAEGLKLMPVGSRMRLCIPSKLGYQDRALDGIPANSDLVFDINMLAITAAPPAVLSKPVDRTCSQKTASGLGYQLLEAGVGAMPTDDYFVLVGYAGYLAKDGAKFDESASTAFPVTGVVPGFSEGLKLMQKGGRYRLCIPSALAYGAQGTGPIPGNSDLIFLVELIDMRSQVEIKALEAAEAAKAPQ